MNRDQDLARLEPWADKAARFTGWNLSGVKPKLLDPGPPWKYEDLIREYAEDKKQALDMGTGGGELLSQMRHALPQRTIATEEWKSMLPSRSVDSTPSMWTQSGARASTYPLLVRSLTWWPIVMKNLTRKRSLESSRPVAMSLLSK